MMLARNLVSWQLMMIYFLKFLFLFLGMMGDGASFIIKEKKFSLFFDWPKLFCLDPRLIIGSCTLPIGCN